MNYPKSVFELSDEDLREVRKWRAIANELRRFRAKSRCELCQRSKERGVRLKLKGHHIIRPLEGGLNTRENCLITCDYCYENKLLKWSNEKMSKYLKGRIG